MTVRLHAKQQQSYPHQQWYIERAKFYRDINLNEEKALDELRAFTQATTDTISHTRESISIEVNEYERHATGYFTLAISFIIGGLLSNQISNVGGAETHAARVLFFITIIMALISALVLFFEYIITFRFFNKWQKNQEEVLRYVNSHTWEGPDELNQWIDAKQKEVPQKSTHVIQIVEISLLALAFLFLALWLIEKLFNPNWPLF